MRLSALSVGFTLLSCGYTPLPISHGGEVDVPGTGATVWLRDRSTASFHRLPRETLILRQDPTCTVSVSVGPVPQRTLPQEARDMPGFLRLLVNARTGSTEQVEWLAAQTPDRMVMVRLTTPTESLNCRGTAADDAELACIRDTCLELKPNRPHAASLPPAL